ncbi:MAG: hypothetical protein HKN32_00225 [Flavobacteriales bacterium]|nr:hypothetical protein [Flavobacteriales bacterium]
MELTRSIFEYLRCFTAYIRKRHDPKAIAFSSLTQKHSYRLVASAHTDRMIGFRYLKKALELVFSNREQVHRFRNGNSAIFDGHEKQLEQRQEYLEMLADSAPAFFLQKEALGIKKLILSRFLEALQVVAIGIFIIPISIFHSRRGSIALNLLELVECARLIELLRANQVDTLYFFCSYNKDSNFIALRLKKHGIRCVRVPSSNPNNNFYKQVVSDVFALTAPYQKNELEALKTNYFVDEYVEWPVFNFQSIYPLLNEYDKPKPNTLGLISSGTWRRQERGDMALGIGDQESELRVLEFLKQYLTSRPEINFSIFMHPIEKASPELIQKAQAHYDAYFAPTQVTLLDPSKATFQLFDQVDVSIAAYSSANMERLYAGFKTLYAPLGMRTDFYAGSSLENIAAFDESDLGELLDRSFRFSVDEFFEKNQLQEYHHSYYSDRIHRK